MNCNHCGKLMVDAFTTFTVLKDDAVYVVEDVPCLECPLCGHESFTQDIAKELEKYCSGRAIPLRAARAWVYKWGTTIIEIPRSESETSTENTPLPLSIVGTGYDR